MDTNNVYSRNALERFVLLTSLKMHTMIGNIADIDYIAGSDGDQEGGITVILRDKSEIVAYTIEFDVENMTFETS
jgi:hypothetical protein